MPPRPDQDGGGNNRQDLEEPLLAVSPSEETTTSRLPPVAPVIGRSRASCEEGGGRNNVDDARSDPTTTTDTVNKDIEITLCCSGGCFGRRRRTLKLNHNVFLNIALCILYGMSDSLWSGTVFAAYLKRLGHEENSIVGNIEALNGLAVLFSALPVGYLADRYGRDKLIRLGGFLFIGTAILHGWTMTWIGTDETAMSDSARHTSLILLAIVMALWGIGGGIVTGPAQALYADSTPVGERSQYYHYLFVAYLVSSCLGPIVSIALFRYMGDDWNLYQLRTIVYVGLGMEMSNAVLMMFFDDSKALDESEGGDADDDNDNDDDNEAETTRTPAPTTTTENVTTTTTMTTQEETQNNTLTEPLLSETTASTTGSEPITTFTTTTTTTAIVPMGEDDTATATIATDPPTALAAAVPAERRWMIPYIIFISSLVFSIGSGMTVKFFPLFFKEEVGMSPSQVQIIYVLVPIVMALLSGVGTRLSKKLGRVETTILLQVSGVSCLFAMVFFKRFLDVHPFILVPVYILRTGFMNCPYPLMESILMDFVPKQQRARWKSLESIAQFGWCGSAAAGGYISDRWDYTQTFFVTAVIQSCGIFLTSWLLPLVPRIEGSETTSRRSTSGSNPNAAAATTSNGAGET